ncbi:MAG: ligase-associated DNA damage response DEXH box helicase [Alphaproteobacteria bacterium]|nr:ligase-associated DNA damage response DEXH box helicase [Alphaproteobacteria bacterium]
MADTQVPDFALPDRFASWFAARGWSARPHQLVLTQTAMAGDSALLIAPTGGGKTLAGFLASLIELERHKQASNSSIPSIHTLYISPLKALAVDVARNLMTPVEEMGLDVRIETRTGDTPQSKRQRQRRNPPDILLTTPEQLALFIASDHAAEFFADLKCVIIDEIHAIAPSKRGDLLSLGLATLARWAPTCRFIGLSATVKDPAMLQDWLAVSRRPVRLIEAAGGVEADIGLLVSREEIPWAGHSGRFAVPEVYEQIKQSRLSLVFVNTRAQAELLFQELWTINEDGLAIALHHGSLVREQRRKVEAAMAAGRLKAVVCTSTLDLGIDWGEVDLVIQMGAPKGAARLIQRIGRANHRMDEASRALLVPSNRFEIIECKSAEAAVMAGDIDGEDMRDGSLDVLAQYIMGRACGAGFAMDPLYEDIIAAAPYRGLDWETFERVVDLVATGGYALKTYDRFKRIVRGRDGLWHAVSPRDAQQHRMNVGAIVESQLLNVRLASRVGGDKAGQATGRQALRGGRKLGEIEEYFINSLTPGDTFLFAGEIFRFLGVSEMDALVMRAPGEKRPAIPSYNGGKFPLTTFLAARVRRMIHDRSSWSDLPDAVREWFHAQEVQSVIPADNELLIETFARAGRHYLVCYPFEGRLAHQTMGMLMTRRLERMGVKPLGFVASEYALSVWAMEPIGSVDMDDLFAPDMLGDDLEAWLNESVMMKRHFAQCAQISGLIARRMPGGEKTGRQVTFSTDLIYDVLRDHEPDHILLQAARQDAATGFLDIRRLSDMLVRVQGHMVHRDLTHISPFAVPVMLEIGRVPVLGAETEDALIRLAESELIAEAMGDINAIS